MTIRRQVKTFHHVALIHLGEISVREDGAYVAAFRYAIAVFIIVIGMINPNQTIKCD